MSSPRESISSPRVHQRISSLVKGASSAPSSPVQHSKPDRTADFAAVRNLAESYGVDLLPLEMGFTPLKTQAKATDTAAHRISTADSATDLPNTPEVGESAAAAAANRGLAQAYSDGSATFAGQDTAGAAARARSPRPRPASPSKPPAGPAPGGAQDAGRHTAPAGPALGCFPIEVDGSEVNTDSPYAEADLLDGAGKGSILYLDEELLPVEERVTLLEEERDILVDKLLSTTEALHASEARNRQSEASQSQVHALLEQLQELLRRAEVERDRAKLQLKRHRASNSQFLFPALPALGAIAASPDAFAIGPVGFTASAGGQVPEGALTARPRSKKYKVSVGGAPPTAETSSTSTAAAASQDLFAAAGAAAAPSESTGDTPAAAAGEGSGSADGASTAASAARGQVSPASAQEQQKPSESSVAGLGTWGSRRGSRDSSCDSSDAVSPACTPEAVTLTPSTDDARPPVSSVVRGFEALLNRQRAPWGSSGGPGSTGGRSGRELSARSSGSGSRSASPLASRGGSELLAVAVVQAEALVAAPGDSPAGGTGQHTPAAASAPAVHPLEAAAEDAEAACKDTDGGAEQGGLSAQSSEMFRKTYVDAAVAGAEAERSRRSLAGSTRGATSARTAGPGSTSSSVVSAATTPTAAALYNAAPVGSYMLDSSCFSEEEEVVSAGGALLAAGRASTAGPHDVYDPSRFTPVRPVDRVFVSTTDGGSPAAPALAEVLPGVKRGRSTSPAASPTAQQQHNELTSSSSPGSAFGSMISCGADSPGGSVTQSPAANMSCPGAASTGSAASSYSNGGSSRGKGRSASRLGLTSSPAAALPAERQLSSAGSKQQQGHKGSKGQGQQQGSVSAASKSISGSSSGGGDSGSSSKKHSAKQSVDPTADASLTASVSVGGSKSAKVASSASVRSKQAAKNAPAPASSREPSAARTGVTASSTPAVRTQAGSRALQWTVLAVALILSALAVVFVWLRSQARLAAMQAQLQQLQRQLSEASAECPSGLDAPGEL